MQFRTMGLGAIIAVALSIPVNAYATNGMFVIGVGAKSRAMGGVGIGYTQDAFNNAQNPASLTELGIRLDLDAIFFRPSRQATMPDSRGAPNGGNPVTYKSGATLFVIPAMAGAYKFSRKMSIGFSFHGAGGGSTRYTRLAPNGENFLNPLGRQEVGDTLGVLLFNAQMAMSAAYRVNKNSAIGASIVGGIQQFRAYGLGLFQPFSSDPENLSNRGNDYAYGAGIRLGWKGRFFDRLSLGAAYQSRIYFTKFDKYAGLFAEQGSLDTPENIGVGIAIELTKKLDLAFDVLRVNYSDVAAIGNPVTQLLVAKLGDKDGPGFGWEDQTIYKVGLKYNWNSMWDIHLGFNHAKSPIPSDQLLFNTLAPAVTEDHITLGTTYRPNKEMEWTVTYVKGLRNEQKGLADSGGQFDFAFPSSTGTGPGKMEIAGEQDSLEISFSYKL